MELFCALAGHLVLLKMSKTYGPPKKVLDIWSHLVLFKMSMETFVHAKRFLIFGPVQSHLARTFWIGPNFKDLLVWTKCFMNIWDGTKCLLTILYFIVSVSII